MSSKKKNKKPTRYTFKDLCVHVPLGVSKEEMITDEEVIMKPWQSYHPMSFMHSERRYIVHQILENGDRITNELQPDGTWKKIEIPIDETPCESCGIENNNE